jgi:hypothetical protein
MPSGGADDPRSYFHSVWYASRYPQVRQSGLTPWTHYTTVGERAGYQPHPFFEPAWYRIHNEISSEPLDHYAKVGRLVAARPHPLLHPVNYAEDIRELSLREPAGPTPLLSSPSNASGHPVLLRYLLSRDEDWRFPNPWFDRSWYRHTYGQEMGSYGDPLSHYTAEGGFRGNSSGQFWDWRKYLDRNPDVFLSQMTPLEHFIRAGRHESRRPTSIPLMSMIKQAASQGDLDLVVETLQGHLGWKSSGVEIVRLVEPSPTLFRTRMVVHQLSTAILVQHDRSASLIGVPDDLHQVDSHLVLGKSAILAAKAPRRTTDPILLAPYPSSESAAAILVGSILHSLDWGTPMFCSPRTAGIVRRIFEQMGHECPSFDAADALISEQCIWNQPDLQSAIRILARKANAIGVALDVTPLVWALRPSLRIAIRKVVDSEI